MLRSSALAMVLWLALTLTRARNVHLQKMLWATVVLASLAMPFLMHARLTPVIAASPRYVVALRVWSGGSTTHSSVIWEALEVVYGLTALTLLCRLAYGLLRTWRIRSSARVLHGDWTSGLDVRASEHAHAPATFGTTVLLPAGYAGWNREKLTAVIAHERAHIINGDCYLLWLARLHTCIFWFNPCAWWIQHQLDLLAETTSDEAAVAALGDQPRYAEILLEFTPQAGATAPPVTLAMARPKLSQRIEHILSGVVPSSAPKFSQRVLVMLALLPAVVAAAAPVESDALKDARPNSSLDTRTNGAAGGPSIIGEPNLPNLTHHYPPEALKQRIEGRVSLTVTLDAEGRATDTLILWEDPQGYGFGAAASATAHDLEYRNPIRRPTQFTFMVKFSLSDDPQTQEPAPTTGSATAGSAQPAKP
jgi:TonB family protein